MSTAPAARSTAASGGGAAWFDSALVVVASRVFAFLIGGGRPLLAYDAFRDMAYARGMLAGGPWRDPSLSGLPAWYPPGHAHAERAGGGPGAGHDDRVATGGRGQALGGLLAAPALLPKSRGPVVNEAPRHWFAPELHDLRFALHAHTPRVWIPGLAGLAMAWRAGEARDE